MAKPNPFLRARLPRHSVADLGRVFKVVQQTWRATDDPRRVRPRSRALVRRRTASDAADLARAAASAYADQGFDKSTGVWWGADSERFHRFVVAGRRGHPFAALAFAAVAAAIAVFTLASAAEAEIAEDRPG